MNNKVKEIIEGVIINHTFLSKDEFKLFIQNIFTNNPNLNSWRTHLLDDLNFVIKNYDAWIKLNPLYGYQIWEDINKKYFNNTPVSILAASNLGPNKAEEINVYQADIESAILGGGEKKLYASESKLKKGNKLVAHDVANSIFFSHYQNMSTFIKKEKPTNQEIRDAYYNNKIDISRKDALRNALLAKQEDRFTYYQQAFFKTGTINTGTIWEAYIHHLANVHNWQLGNYKFQANNKFINEENFPHFLTSLYAATGGYTYTAGGDVIILDDKGNVISNIQVKGKAGIKGAQIGHDIGFYTAKREFLIPLQQLLKKGSPSQDDIDFIYNKLKNQAWIETGVKKALEESEINNLITSMINNKININI